MDDNDSVETPQLPNLKKRVSVKEIVQESIKSLYKFEKILGEGAFGKVKSAHLLTDPSKKFAIKSIPRHLMDKELNQNTDDGEEEIDRAAMAKLLNQEINIVLHMDHPNIVKFYQCVYDNEYINIVMELVNGKTLSDFILEQKTGRIPEI